MRLLGNLPDETTATLFSNVLLGVGIDHEVEPERDGAATTDVNPERWVVWVRADEDLPRAEQLLARFRAEPGSREWEGPSREGAVRRRMREEDEALAAGGKAGEGTGDGRGRAALRRVFPDGVGALTAVLAGTCLAITCAAWAGYEDRVFDELLLTRLATAGRSAAWDGGLPEIFEKGEFWRLITPALVHFHVAHLLLNLICLVDLGSAIEARQGTGRLGALFVTIAIGSNLGQAWLEGPGFCGISGVLYGLLGYLWMKGKFDPDLGLALHPYTVILMWIFFVLGFGGAFLVAFGVSMANGAHATGLALGIVWGLLTSIPGIRARWRQRK